MGTNYYVRPAGAPVQIHLGKMSVGWPFAFRAHSWDQGSAILQWMTLATAGPITDEYGHTVTLQSLLWHIMQHQDHAEIKKNHNSYENFGFQFIDGEFC